MKGYRQIFCAGCAYVFRWLGTKLGSGCNRVADWFEERAR